MGGALASPSSGGSSSATGVLSSALTACRSRPATVCACRGRRCEATKTPGGNTLASSCSSAARRRQPRTSVPSPVHSVNAANPSALCLALCDGASPLTDHHMLTHARRRVRRLKYDRQRGRGRRDGRRRLLLRRPGSRGDHRPYSPFCSKKCMSCGRGVACDHTLYMGPMHVLDSIHSMHDVSTPNCRLSCTLRIPLTGIRL